ncbi:hypothetical protein VZT92_017648 [Zoarces viviparus]|uniref:Uncharacterized protein n=1 Tax=Zoarces viviparus TaxID=48416 RepID=A0AAW1ELY4_ZOAVI
MLSALATIDDRSTERPGSRRSTSLNCCRRFTRSDEPNPTALRRLELWFAPLRFTHAAPQTYVRPRR